MRLIFVITEDWYFLSHRLPLAIHAKKLGWDVLLVGRMGPMRSHLDVHGIRAIHLDVNRGGMNPLRDLKYCRTLAQIYRAEQPDIVHHVAMKPCLYGSLAAWWAGVPCVVNALAGMGYLFSASHWAVKLVRMITLFVFARLFGRNNSRLILQNLEDIQLFRERIGILDSNLRLIKGSGVDLHCYCPMAKTKELGNVLVVMVSRLLKDKGVVELVEAAKLLHDRGIRFRLVLVGDADPHNPHAVSQGFLDGAKKCDPVELWGRRQDVAAVYQQADVAVLPSYYREGLPKTLMEAAACGLPIITTDTPGCRETVPGRMSKKGTRQAENGPLSHETGEYDGNGWLRVHDLKIGANGILVPPRDVESLSEAMGMLVRDADMRRKMGRCSRDLAEKEFGVERVVKETFEVYEDLLSRIGRSHLNGRATLPETCAGYRA